MSLTSQIGSTDASFKLSQKIVSALAEKFSFKFEDGWAVVSTRTIEHLQKRLKRDKRRANPTSSIKHPRTAFSFFTQKQRPVVQAANPKASFGDLSRFVSEAWKALTPTQMADFKALETADKERYQTERSAVLASLANAPPAATTVEVEAVDEPVKEKKVRKVKSAAPATESAAPVVEAAAPVAAPAKKAKVAKVVAAPVAAPAAVPVVEATPAKKVKTPKAASTTAAPAVAPAVAPVAEAAAPVAKAAKPSSGKTKAVKA